MILKRDWNNHIGSEIMTSNYSQTLIKNIGYHHDKIDWHYFIDEFPSNDDNFQQLIKDLTDKGFQQYTYDFENEYDMLVETNEDIDIIKDLITNANIEANKLVMITNRLKMRCQIRLQQLIERFINQDKPERHESKDDGTINPTRIIMESSLFTGI